MIAPVEPKTVYCASTSTPTSVVTVQPSAQSTGVVTAHSDLRWAHDLLHAAGRCWYAEAGGDGAALRAHDGDPGAGADLVAILAEARTTQDQRVAELATAALRGVPGAREHRPASAPWMSHERPRRNLSRPAQL